MRGKDLNRHTLRDHASKVRNNGTRANLRLLWARTILLESQKICQIERWRSTGRKLSRGFRTLQLWPHYFSGRPLVQPEDVREWHHAWRWATRNPLRPRGEKFFQWHFQTVLIARKWNKKRNWHLLIRHCLDLRCGAKIQKRGAQEWSRLMVRHPVARYDWWAFYCLDERSSAS